MDTTELSYWVFGAVLVLAVILDLGLLSKRSKILSIKQAFYQTLFWISLAFAFGVFVWYTEGQMIAI